MNSPERQRLFLALWPDPGTRAMVDSWRNAQLGELRGRPVRRENLHLTIAFLGEQERAARACLENALDFSDLPATELNFDRFGCWSRSRVAWLGCGTLPAELPVLVERTQQVLRSCTIAVESRPWRAHLTLMRNVKRCPEVVVQAPIPWPVHEVVLVSSTLAPEGPSYQIERRWPLAAMPPSG